VTAMVAPSVFVVLIQGMQRAAVRDELRRMKTARGRTERDELDWIEKVGVRYDDLARAAREREAVRKT
jgi:hypothetical protein